MDGAEIGDMVNVDITVAAPQTLQAKGRNAVAWEQGANGVFDDRRSRSTRPASACYYGASGF